MKKEKKIPERSRSVLGRFYCIWESDLASVSRLLQVTVHRHTNKPIKRRSRKDTRWLAYYNCFSGECKICRAREGCFHSRRGRELSLWKIREGAFISTSHINSGVQTKDILFSVFPNINVTTHPLRQGTLRHRFVSFESYFNLSNPTGHVMHRQFNIQQLYSLPTLYLCVLYLSENKQRLVPLTA